MKYPFIRLGVALLLLSSLISCSTTSNKKEDKGSLQVIVKGLVKALNGSEASINITGSSSKTLNFDGSSEQTVTDLAAGNYTVTANPFAGHVVPSSQNIEVRNGETAEVTLNYTLELGKTTQGTDRHSNGNPVIQPNDEPDKQHMESTDVLLADKKGSVLIGVLGRDTLLGDEGDDILIGGPENFVAPNSDVIYGGEGDDINIWAPGDGNDAFLGGSGTDAIIFAPFAGSAPGEVPKLIKFNGRDIPQVSISDKAKFSCAIIAVPNSENLGYEHLVRFSVDGNLKVTVRLLSVEFVYCPSATANNVKVAELAKGLTFDNVALSTLAGTLIGEVMQP